MIFVILGPAFFFMMAAGITVDYPSVKEKFGFGHINLIFLNSE